MELTPDAQSAFGYQDYAARERIDGIEIVELKRFNDDGGAITELGRLSQGVHGQLAGFEVKQLNFSTVEPGVIKAFHLHHRQTDVWYVPPTDRLLLVLHDARKGSPTEGVTMRLMLGDGNNRLIRIPPGIAHGCTNLGDKSATIIYFVDVQFSIEPDECDEGRLPWDFCGAEIWEMVKG
ncbi:MAG: dTDP-4-dehydrorhamnose 3,5-epimerase family protein [Planctomycetes bacterium]|nr:dTDP-4-dehydrorhamnose 3,5-epimerase family protein [Planctomycetota bacterium]